MKILKSELIAYALAFTSFIISKIKTTDIILFGSSVRGEADENSDIDIFINIKEDEEKIKKIVDKELNKFYKSKIAEVWNLKNIKNPIKIHIGDIDKWKLKRSIISEGIVLYGRYKESPENMEGFTYFKVEPIKDITIRNFILRKLFGRIEKNYTVKGFIEEFNGKKLSSLSFLIPINKSHEIIELLSKNKIDYSFFELWSDQINKK